MRKRKEIFLSFLSAVGKDKGSLSLPKLLFQELKAGAIVLFPSVHLKREKSGSYMLVNYVKNSSSRTSFFSSIPCKNTSHFLEGKDSPSSQFQMSRSQTFGEAPNSPTDTFSSSSYQEVKIVVCYTCGIQGKAKVVFVFLSHLKPICEI